jgi:hypothetical protein
LVTLKQAPAFLWRQLLRKVLSPVARGVDIHLAKFPPHRVDAIRVYGRPSFVEFATEALRQLQLGYTHGYRLVQRYLEAIVENDRDLEGVLQGVRYDKETAAGTPPLTTKRYAALLVREAVTQRLISNPSLSDTKNRRTLLFVLKKELDAMRVLGCESKYFHPQQNRILTLERELSELSGR